MTLVQAEVVPDAAQPDGGHAIIRLTGVTRLPLFPNFSIVPQDDAIAFDKLDGWPKGDLRPNSVRDTLDGVDLYIGPDIVEAPDLLAGTPVVLIFGGTEFRAELRWPELPHGPRLNGEPLLLDRWRPVSLVESSDMPVDELVAEPDERQDDDLYAIGFPALKRNGSSVLHGAYDAAPAAILLPEAANAKPDQANPEPAAEPLSVQIANQELAIDTTDTTDTIADDSDHDDTKADAVSGEPIEEQVGQDSGDIAILLAQAPLGEARRVRKPSRTAAAARQAIFGLTMLVGGGLLAPFWSPVGARTAPSPAATLAAIFESEPQSPAGADPTGISREAALERANAFLHGVGQPVDRREAQFWLRRAIAQDFADPRMGWALTQLGSAYASPGPGLSPDYAAASLLWELAGDNGDAVALCFLGQMYQRGLGVRADKAEALKRFERARRFGGCDGLEAAVAELKGG